MIAAADETCGGVVVNQTSVTCPEVMACIAALPTGAPAIAGDLVLGSDNEFHALPADHATVLVACPATGPTVAPTSEGHYFWTSAIGEKWQWIYGDAEPFVIGERYGQIQGAPIPNTTSALFVPFTMPRDGFISASAFIEVDDTNGAGLGADIIAGAYLNTGSGGTLFSDRDLTESFNYNPYVSGSASRIAVVAGDVINFVLRNLSTAVAGNYRVDYQYVN